MFIKRDQEASILYSSEHFPVVAVIGPRQSGKTTLVRHLFSTHTYVNLEEPLVREFASKDPRSFLDNHTQGMIIDEFQHVPELLSYIQTRVDEQRIPGHFILTGSQNFLMNEAITQSLAGRIALHTLLPLSLHELVNNNMAPTSAAATMYRGMYPTLYIDPGMRPEKWYAGYIATYLERDVRSLSAVGDLKIFQLFMQLCAGRIGQLVNLTSLANDCGISDKTARAWLSLLETSFLIYTLQPHHKNFNKRVTKNAKIYFYDIGLAVHLLRMQEEQLATNYMYGGLFENMVISELYKGYYNRDIMPRIYFWRDHTGHEIDCVLDEGTRLIPIEIKSGLTINSDFFKGLSFWYTLTGDEQTKGYLIYGGDQEQKRTIATILGWQHTDSIIADLHD